MLHSAIWISLAALCAALAFRACQLAESRRWVRCIVAHSHEGTAVFDTDGSVIFISDIARNVLDLIPGLRHVHHFESRFECFNLDGTSLPFTEWPVARAARGDFLRNFRMYFKNHANGILGSITVTTAPIHDRRNRVLQILLIIHDYTDHCGTEQELSRINAIVQGTGDGIFSRDIHGFIDNWNSGATEIYGYPAEEMMGRTIASLLFPHDLESEREVFEQVVRRGTIHRYRCLRRSLGNSVIEVAVTCSPIRSASGDIVGVSNISRDITGDAEVEDQRRQSQKLAAIGQLTGGIAHDFNNLLGIIMGNLELLELDLDGETLQPADARSRRDDIRQRTLTAKSAASRAADLTRRLLAFSSQQHLEPRPVAIAEAVGNVIQLAVRALGPHISITTALDHTLGPILVDPSGLESALLNLALNARDAMPEGGTLHFASSSVYLDAERPAIADHILEPGHYACISVSDTGVGMSAATLDRAFDPFFTTKPQGQGTGLGLAMVYGFARQSSGSARITSELGVGTTISLYLRFAQVPAVDEASSPEVEQVPAAAACILLVDDESGLLHIASTYLEKLGYQVLQAPDGPSALELFVEHPGIDLVVTDVLMPGGLNGFELVHRIREFRPSAQCLYTSGFPTGALDGKPFRSADCPMLQKPYRLTELSAAVEKALHPPPAPGAAHAAPTFLTTSSAPNRVPPASRLPL